jgi:hypothetical protein
MPVRRRKGFHPRVWTTPDLLNAGEVVYAITDGSAIKVGKTRGHPAERLKDLQTGNPRLLRLVAYTTHLTEAQAHRRLARCRLSREWFSLAAAVQAELRTWDWLDEAALRWLGGKT